MNSIYDRHIPPSTGGGLYLKLEDGETAKLRIATEPAIYETENTNKQTGEVTFSTRYAWVVWNVDKESAQIFQQSATFFKSIANLAKDEDYGDPVNYDIKVTRNGTGTDTTYQVVPMPNKAPLSKAARDAVDKVDLMGNLKSSPYVKRPSMLSEFEDSQNGPKDIIYDDSGAPTNLDENGNPT